jgi:hypothetical protein
MGVVSFGHGLEPDNVRKRYSPIPVLQKGDRAAPMLGNPIKMFRGQTLLFTDILPSWFYNRRPSPRGHSPYMTKALQK